MTQPQQHVHASSSIIGHGIDAVEVSRIAGMLAEHGNRFRDRCFTSAEQAYCDANPRRTAEHFAARFAAKEAVFKALGTGWRDGMAWTDIEVVRDNASGRPSIALHNAALRCAGERGIGGWHVSLTHTQTLAMASVIAVPQAPARSL
ncbi:MAG: holo-ACP synthase [Phycisphaerales bacterium]